ncbi:MAG TPA: carbohydrate binding domain-containing protein [Candidatus Omnitrophota bacterium]|nr:carbohydrate binding domain-containing protein [Candidatus Omnitrophota bacterium]
MKPFKIAGSILFLSLLVFPGFAAAQDAAPASSQGKKTLVVDDFDNRLSVNNLGGATQGDEEYPGGCIPSFVTKGKSVFGKRGTSLKLEYDVTPPNSFSYYWSKLGPAGKEIGTSMPADLSGYDLVSFWMKTDTDEPAFAFEIHEDTNQDGRFTLGEDSVSRVFPYRYLTSQDTKQWRKVTIPLSDFKKIEHWDRILEVVFVFENKKLKEKKGVVYIDEVTFGVADSNVPSQGFKASASPASRN